MAVHTAYDLRTYGHATCKSFNGSNYTVTIWQNQISGAENDLVLGPNGVSIDWETDSVQDKYSPILTSKLTANFMVTNNSFRAWLEDARQLYEEKSVWLTLRVGSKTGTLVWAGYVIFDLEAREDTDYPIETTLTAIDGLATLRDIPFVRSTNLFSGVAPEFPYTWSDTYVPNGFKRLIGGSGSWFTEIFDKTGMVLSQDTTQSGYSFDNYLISTSMNWWNEDMNVGPQQQYCPMSQMRINIGNYYVKDSEGNYTVPTTYTVLERILKNFNLRCFYWDHTFYIVQINEYNTAEAGTLPASPVNIPTRTFYYNGSQQTNREYVGNTNYSLYKQEIEGNANPHEGLQKLSGSVYNALPAIKNTNCIYNEQAGANYFNGFPLFLTHNDGTLQTPTTWPTNSTVYEYTQRSESQGQYNVMRFTDAANLSGFLVRIYGNFTNTSDTDLKFQTLWTVRAKPADSAWGDSDNMTAYKHQASSYAEVRWMSAVGEFPLANNQQYIRDTVIVPANCSNQMLEIWNSSTTSTTNTTDNLFPIDNSFTGDWDFQFYTFTEFKSTAAYPMRASTETANYSHGRILYSSALDSGTTGGGTTPIEREQVPTYYSVDYTDTINVAGNFESLFVPILNTPDELSVTRSQIQVTQSGANTYEYQIGLIDHGDGSGANTKATIQVWDGSSWIYVNPLGKWAIGQYTWSGSAYTWASLTYDKKLQNLLGEEIMNNQSSAIATFNGTTVLSVNDKFFTGTSVPKFVNPLAKLEDVDGTKFMPMRMTINFLKDEVSGEWVEITRQVPGTVTDGTQNYYGDITDEGNVRTL